MNRQTWQSMGVIEQMLQTHPQDSWLDQNRLSQVIESLNECASTCTACADACLGEQMVAELVHCIRLNSDCADICQTTSRILMRIGEPQRLVIRNLLQTCVAICEACGQECASHAEMHAHCRVCAESCRRCEDACQMLLGSL
jgi:hypothetical protein